MLKDILQVRNYLTRIAIFKSLFYKKKIYVYRGIFHCGKTSDPLLYVHIMHGIKMGFLQRTFLTPCHKMDTGKKKL